MAKSNFITHVVGSLGGKKAGRKPTSKKPSLLQGILLPAEKRRQTMERKYFRPKTHRGHPASHKDAKGRVKPGMRLWFQGDRVDKGSWSEKRWTRARKVDSKRPGKKYEKWERTKTGGWNKKFSWK